MYYLDFFIPITLLLFQLIYKIKKENCEQFIPSMAKNFVENLSIIINFKYFKLFVFFLGIIRAMQEYIENIPRPRVTKRKVFLHELIDKRKKHLKYLRRWDYKRYEWLLEQLNLVYKPAPDVFYRVTRKDSLRKLTDKYCDNIKSERLDEYRTLLEHEKSAFLEEKLRCLQFIREEEQNCGKEVTITEENINDVKKQLEELQHKIKGRQKTDEE